MSRKTRLDGGKRIGRQVATLLFAFMIVSQAFTAPVAAATSSDGMTCSGVDSSLYALFHVGSVGLVDETYNAIWGEDHPCDRQYVRAEAIAEMEASDAEQTQTDIYSAASNQKAQRQVGTVIQGNYVNDSKTVAWSKAEVQIAGEYQNGSTEVEARIAANESIESYYSRQQLNLIKRFNASASGLKVLENQSDMEDGIGDAYVSGVIAYDSRSDVKQVRIVTESVTLANGSTVDVKAVQLHTGANRNTTVAPSGVVSSEEQYGAVVTDWGTPSAGNYESTAVWGVVVAPPTSDYSELRYIEFKTFTKQWNNIESANKDVKTDVDPYVTATYDAYKDGRLEPRDVMSRQTKMFEYGTDGAASNASMYDSIAALSAMGLNTPDLNNTGMMTVEYGSGQTVTGIVMAHHAPNGTWRTDTTYNAQNISGPVWVASSEGEEVEIQGEFRIVEMTNTQGEDVTHVDTTRYNYQTASISELTEKLNRLLELRQEIEAREPDTASGGGTSGSNIPFGLTAFQFAALCGGAVVALYALKDVLLTVLGLYSP